MAAGWRKQIPAELLLQLLQQLDRLPHESPKRGAQVRAKSELYGISTTSVCRALKDFFEAERCPPHRSRQAERAAEFGTGAVLRAGRCAQTA